MPLELELYRTRNGKEPFRTWYESLARDHRAFDAITRRLSRLRAGHYGNHKSIGRKGSGPLILNYGSISVPDTGFIANGFRLHQYCYSAAARKAGNKMTSKWQSNV